MSQAMVSRTAAPRPPLASAKSAVEWSLNYSATALPSVLATASARMGTPLLFQLGRIAVAGSRPGHGLRFEHLPAGTDGRSYRW